MSRWIIRLFVAIFLIAPSAAAMAHGDYEDSDQQSTVYGPIQSATVAVADMKVASYEAARESVTQAAQAQGARLADLHTWVDPKGRKHGWIRFSLPADRLAALLPSVYGVGKLYSEKMSHSDYQSDSSQLAARVAALERHEARLDGVLNSNRRLRGSDLLYIQERLFRADVDAGMLQQQRADMASAEGSASLLVELFEPGTLPVASSGRIDLKKWFAASLVRARTEASRQLARAATAGAYALVFAPVWVPGVVLFWLVLWLLWRMRRRFIAYAAQLYQLWRTRDPSIRLQAGDLPE